MDYLLKPISFERLLQAVNKFIGESDVETENASTKITQEIHDFIFVRADRKMVKINFSEINYVESFSDYLKFHLHEKIIVTRETISSIEAKLPKADFLRIHRSYIVSISKIESFTNEFIEVNKKALPISRTYKKEVLHRLENS